MAFNLVRDARQSSRRKTKSRPPDGLAQKWRPDPGVGRHSTVSEEPQRVDHTGAAPDLGGKATTRQVTDAVKRALEGDNN